jgi:hypothetical protein
MTRISTIRSHRFTIESSEYVIIIANTLSIYVRHFYKHFPLMPSKSLNPLNDPMRKIVFLLRLEIKKTETDI